MQGIRPAMVEPSSSSLLLFNTTSTQGLQSILDTTAEQLDDLNETEEECMKEILEMCQELSLSDQSFQDPTEAVTFIHEQHVLDNLTCFDLDPDHITKLLRHQMLMTERYPGCEELVIGQMLELSSVDGVSLPTHSSLADPVSASRLSINTATGSSTEHLNQTLWSELCSKLKRHLVENLRRPCESDTQHQREKRLRYVESMCALFPAGEVWGVYKGVRSLQTDRLIANISEDDETERPRTFQNAALHLATLAEQMKAMITEDFYLFSSGVFGSVMSNVASLHELYYDKILEEITSLIDGLHDEMPQQRPSPSHPDTINRNPAKKREMTKSSSEHSNILEQLKTNLRRQKSSSMDSLIMRNEVAFTELQGVPLATLEPLRVLVEALLDMEVYREGLEDLLSWDITGNTLPKRSLKSALKVTKTAEQTFTLDQSPGVKGQGMWALDSSSLAQMNSPFKVVEKVCETLPRWNWRVLFRKVMPDTAKCLEVHIHRAGGQVLATEWQRYEAGMEMELVAVDSDLVGGRLDYPSQISQGMYHIWNVLETNLPLALAGSEGCFVMLRSAYVETMVNIFKTHMGKVQKYLAELSEFVPTHSMYALLSGMAYTRNLIMHYQTKLGLEEASGRPLNLLYRRYCENVDSLSKRVIEYHIRILSTSVLMDAESQNYSDSKQFYEGERCSFPVQMWLLYMRRLKHDTWHCCPPQLAQAIYLAVLQDSLSHLTTRYSSVCPSYARFQQHRTDITSILACVGELLWSSCNNLSQILQPSALSHKQHHSIHNSCCHLLATLAIVTAPLQTLVDSVYVSGRGEDSWQDEDGEEPINTGHVSHWLHWLYPDIIPLQQTSCSSLQTTTAIQLHLELITCQPHITYTMLLQVLFMKDYTLSILLGTQLALAPSESPSSHHTDHPCASTESLSGSVQLEMNTEVCSARRDMLFCLLHLLAMCDSFPDALAKVILPLIERTDSWGLFESLGSGSSQKRMPVWTNMILAMMEKFTIRVIEPGLKLMVERVGDSPHLEPLHTKMSQLPCGCGLHHSPPHNLKDGMAEVMYSLIQQLSHHLASLPLPLIILLKKLEAQSALRQRSPAHPVALSLLALALRNTLLNPEQISGILGVESLHSDLTDMLIMIAECITAILTPQGSAGKSSAVPRAARLFMKANHSWVKKQLHAITTYVNNQECDGSERYPLDGGMTDLLLDTQVAAVVMHPNGRRYLEKLNSFVTENVGWVGKLLDFHPFFSKHHRSSVMSFGSHPQESNVFHPLQMYSLPTNSSLTQLGQDNCQFNWQDLLACDLGISEVGLRMLVNNRYELHDIAHLDKEERKLVQTISNRFHLDLSL